MFPRQAQLLTYVVLEHKADAFIRDLNMLYEVKARRSNKEAVRIWGNPRQSIAVHRYKNSVLIIVQTSDINLNINFTAAKYGAVMHGKEDNNGRIVEPS